MQARVFFQKFLFSQVFSLKVDLCSCYLVNPQGPSDRHLQAWHFRIWKGKHNSEEFPLKTVGFQVLSNTTTLADFQSRLSDIQGVVVNVNTWKTQNKQLHPQAIFVGADLLNSLLVSNNFSWRVIFCNYLVTQ